MSKFLERIVTSGKGKVVAVALFIAVLLTVTYKNRFKLLDWMSPLDYCRANKDSIAYPALGYQWKKITCDGGFGARDGAGALVYNDSMWLLGGWNNLDRQRFPLHCNNDIWRSSNGSTWSMVLKNKIDGVGDSMWAGRHAAGYAVYESKMWIIGGDANQGYYQQDVWHSNDGVGWVQVCKTMPIPPRVFYLTLVFKNKIWILGGQTLPQFAKEEDRIYNDIWNSVDGKSWQQVTVKSPHWEPRSISENGVEFKDKMWIIGGGTYDTPERPRRTYFTDVWNSSDGVNWSLISDDVPWGPRQFHAVTVFDNKLWLIGGFHKWLGNKNDVWYSEDGKVWTELPNTPWEKRHATSVFVYKGRLWVVTGQNLESDVWTLSKLK